MGDTMARDHPVDLAGIDHLMGAETVAMLELSVIKIGNGAQPDMWMRPDVDPLTGQKLRRAGLIEEDKGTDHLPLRRGQRAAHFETAQIAGARDDQGFNVIKLTRIGAGRVQRRVPAHGVSFRVSAS